MSKTLDDFADLIVSNFAEKFLSNNKEYIGDGVYVVFDGCGIMLKANDFHNPTDQVYLEPEVLSALIRFAERMGMKKEIK